ncbi:hypothetical protein GOD82_27750 [Sinorhizobium medicae]|nr:hypothetical protein [Sinorhizobium medicae]
MSTKIEDDDHAFYTFNDLKERRIVSSRTALHFLIHGSGFPKPLKRGKHMQSAAYWRRSDVNAWLDREFGEQTAAE